MEMVSHLLRPSLAIVPDRQQEPSSSPQSVGLSRTRFPGVTGV